MVQLLRAINYKNYILSKNVIGHYDLLIWNNSVHNLFFISFFPIEPSIYIYFFMYYIL